MEVLTRDELLARTGSRWQLTKALERDEWKRVLRGTYVPGATVVDLRVRVRAALRLLPARCLVADRCLLWLLGVDVLPPGPPVLEVVVERGAVVPKLHGIRAREALLPLKDRWVLEGVLPVLRPTRATADLMRRLPLVEAVVVTDAVVRAGLSSPADLQTELLAHRGLRGVRNAQQTLTLSDGRAESPQESRTRVLLVQAGLSPVPQHEVRDARGRLIARVDLAFPDAKVAIEYDGRDVHLQGDAFVRERRRQNALLAAGWTVLRYTADDLRNRPQVVLAEVRAALARSGR